MKKKNHIKMRFSTLLLCCLAFVLCAAPCGWAVDFDDGLEHDVTTADLDYMSICSGTTVNLYDSPVSNSSIEGIYAGPGSILNIYSGSVGYIAISPLRPDKPNAVVTVFGTNFEVDWELNGSFVSLDGADEFTPLSDIGSVVLKGTYGNGDPIVLWFLSDDIPIKIKEIEVDIDIKPGSDLNSINLKSKGVVPVAVFTITGFNAGTIDPGTVLFAGASPERWKLCDVDGDGDDDRLFHFKTENLVELDVNSTVATLTGTTFGGDDIELTDTVRIVQSKKE